MKDDQDLKNRQMQMAYLIGLIRKWFKSDEIQLLIMRLQALEKEND